MTSTKYVRMEQLTKLIINLYPKVPARYFDNMTSNHSSISGISNIGIFVNALK
jgi:hypothetical protein